MAMSSKVTKRKCVVLSLEDKLAVLDRLKAGVSHAKLAEENGIGRENLILCIDNGQHGASYIQFSYLAIYPSHYGWTSEGPLYLG